MRNSEGHPVRARVAAVTESGSVSTGTRDDGTFELTDAVWTKSVVYATTEDDCFAIATGVEPGATGIELVVSQGGAIVVHANQPQDVRCALFQGATRFEDFTLRVGKPARVVVPPGKVRVRLYTPTATIAERELHVEGSTAQDVDLSTAL
ncbi:MAG: hypothetical protein IT459_13035 [Planctomycetes bacterium]|nr:hypothetical protein [Planctomycetota bacterium]